MRSRQAKFLCTVHYPKYSTLAHLSFTDNHRPMWRAFLAWCIFVGIVIPAMHAQVAQTQFGTNFAQTQLAEYFKTEVHEIASRCLAEIKTRSDWETHRMGYRKQLLEMLGLTPVPERTELHPVVTARLEHDGIVIENVQFQALPRVYCTANLYLPKELPHPAPAILYLCGHLRQTTNGISLGNKTAYQHDGLLFARNGYICLVLDSLQLGEIMGVHTGTRDLGMWWWNSRGYTPAGVEAWFAIRALDYLCSRPEVDTNKLGVTGHSGGGAYSWTVAALDDRVKAAAPLAGLADLQSHIIDGVLDRHCDCNFFINIYRWDFPQLAALAAPRPVLIGGTDNDPLFRLDSTIRIYQKLKRIYDLLDAPDKLGLAIAPGQHTETQELRFAVLRWFNKFLKHEPAELTLHAPSPLHREQLRVFDQLPTDALNTNAIEVFSPCQPQTQKPINKLRTALRQKVFCGWPADEPVIEPELAARAERQGTRISVFKFSSQHNTLLQFFLLEPSNADCIRTIELEILDQVTWADWLKTFGPIFSNGLTDELPTGATLNTTEVCIAEFKPQLPKPNTAHAFFAPRGIGPTAWSTDEKTLTKIRRRFMLLGQTLDGMRVWDIRCAIRALNRVYTNAPCTIELRATGNMAVNALYAALFEPTVSRLDLFNMPTSHMTGPDYFNVLKITDIPQVAKAVSEGAELKMSSTEMKP